MNPLRIALLGSGKGSNARAILQSIASGHLDAQPVAILSDVPGAGILALGPEFGVPARLIPAGKFRHRLEPETEAALASELKSAGAELILLAGYMRIIKTPLLDVFPRRILNIHPSLLPAFPGLEAWKQALSARVPETGCTVHLVDTGVDTGPILGQTPVPVHPNDTPESLHARIQLAERQLYPHVLHQIATRQIILP